MERNIRVDYYKIFLSILVVCIHIQPLFAEDQFLSWFISNGLSRMAVPSFFIISGYYLYPKLGDNKTVKKYIIRLCIIYATWAIVYSTFYIHNSVKSVLLYVAFGYDHLWYLPASIIGVLMVFLSKKVIKKDVVIFIIALLLYISSIIVSIWKGVDYFTIYYFRNGITVGFLFTMIGCLLKDRNLAEKIKDKHLILLICAGIILLLAESYHRFHYFKNLGPYQDLLLSTLILSPALFMYILKKTPVLKKPGFINVLSTGIYFIHPYIIYLMNIGYGYSIYKLPLILLYTIIVSFFVYYINKYIKIFF